MKKNRYKYFLCFMLAASLCLCMASSAGAGEGWSWELYDVSVNTDSGSSELTITDGGETVLATDSVSITLTSNTSAQIYYSFVGKTVYVDWEAPPDSFPPYENLVLRYSGNESGRITNIFGTMSTQPSGSGAQADPTKMDSFPGVESATCYISNFSSHTGSIYYRIHIYAGGMSSAAVDVVYEYRRSAAIYEPEADEQINTRASDTAGEDESASVDIPTAVIAGGAAVGAIVIGSAIRKRKKKNDSESASKKAGTQKKKPTQKEAERGEEKARSKFRMVLYKEFGDTLIVGEAPRGVYARIEELPPGGGRLERPDLTAMIRIFAGENIAVLKTGMAGKYMAAAIEAKAPESGVVSFSFSFGAARLQNNVTFKIVGEPKIVFADEGLTFVACDAQCFSMPFFVEGMGREASLSAVIDSGGSCFSVSVSPGEGVFWNADICEHGTTRLIPGTMEEYKCTVTATQGERSVSGSFSVFRYHEGLRLNIGALKCYAVVMADLRAEQLSEDANVKQTPAHTRVELTLYTWDIESGELRNPVPDEAPQFRFEDIPGSDVLADLKGSAVDRPCETLKFTYELLTIAFNTNTLVGEIYPTGGILVPPNRSRAVVTARVGYGGREFTAKQEVTLTSQPYRGSGDIKEGFAQLEQDNKYTDNLRRIQRKILWEESYSELRPMSHKIELMLRGYSSEYGYYMPDYLKILRLYEHYTTGELGSVEANEQALSWKGILSDGLMLTVTDFSESGRGISGRLVIGLLTGGASEIVFLPMQVLSDMKKYVDRGGDSALEGFVVGLKTVAVEQLTGYLAGKAMKVGFGALSAGADALKRGALAAKQSIERNAKQLVKNFSSVRYAQKLSTATQNTTKQLIAAKKAAENHILRSRRLIEESVDALAADEAFVLGRREGMKKVYELRKAIKRAHFNPDHSKRELREYVLAVQQDKHAMHQLKESLSLADDGLRARFNREMGEIYDEAIMGARKRLAKKYNVPIDDIQIAQASGHSDELAKLGKSVGMDKDVTFRIKTASGVKDISEDIAGDAYNSEFYRAAHCGVEAVDKNVAERFAQMCDQSVVSGTGRESYGSWDDLQRVLQKSRAGERFDDANRVASTVTYKSEHWLRQAEQGYAVAREAAERGDAEVARYALSGAEALAEEGVRQSTKQFDRIVVPRLEILATRDRAPEMQLLMEKMALLKKIGLGTHGSTGITLSEAREVLKSAYGTTIEEIVQEAEEAILTTNNLL